MDVLWNVTRGDDGTIIETIDPNTPMVKQMLRDELEKTKEGVKEEILTMTVQEKMLMLLKLLRDRVKVEAVIGNDAHARNLKVLAYCLKAANDEERQQLILEELGSSLGVSAHDVIAYILKFSTNLTQTSTSTTFLQSLDIFSDLITASIDYAEARSNDFEASVSPVLDISKLQKIKIIVERLKGSQRLKASGISPEA